jgi:hypothetical protein
LILILALALVLILFSLIISILAIRLIAFIEYAAVYAAACPARDVVVYLQTSGTLYAIYVTISTANLPCTGYSPVRIRYGIRSSLIYAERVSFYHRITCESEGIIAAFIV